MQAAAFDDAGDGRPVRIPLSVNDPNAGSSLTRSVDRMLRGGRRAPVVVELHGSHLPAPLVAALIGNLRRLREAGVGLTAIPATPALRNAMALHGLDRVLAVSGAARGGAARGRSAVRETAWPLFALLLFVVTAASVVVLLQLGPGSGGM
jgi:hypothetical protein